MLNKNWAHELIAQKQCMCSKQLELINGYQFIIFELSVSLIYLHLSFYIQSLGKLKAPNEK